MDAITLLKSDHEKVSAIFEKLEPTTERALKTREELFAKLKAELDVHAHIEETIFYPAIIKNEEIKDIVMEGLEEHKQAKTLLREIPNLSDGSEKFEAKLKVLMEDIEHHVKEEEEEMFPKVKKAFDKEELEELGAELETAKQDFKKSYKASAGK